MRLRLYWIEAVLVGIKELERVSMIQCLSEHEVASGCFMHYPC